jgi:hypothetical protein|tara:strand:+ start:1610 stop:1837 length:228 start_codon:yes stop_codon:yes gene_type:complete
MDGVDVFKLFASDFGTVSVFAGERMINMMMMMMMMIQDDDEKKMCRYIVSFSLFSKQKSSSKLKAKVTPIFFSES